MALAKSRVEYKREDFSKPKPQSKDNYTKGGEKKWSKDYSAGKDGSNKAHNRKKHKRNDKQKDLMPKTNCFLCDNPKTNCFLCDNSH